MIAGAPSTSVPRRRTSFVGRDSDLAAVLERLDTSALITLLGPGGVGKTRLAYEVAGLVEGQTDTSVHIVELARSSGDVSVDRLVADALGLPVSAEQVPTDAIAAHVGAGGPTLLVLDNCEHVIESSASLVDQLLDRCPSLSVLATSRIPLRVDGEVSWPVDPLAVIGDPGHVSPAVRLLVDRAVAAHPRALDGTDPARLEQLASSLDGIPLALELAAARLGTMDVVELINQIERHLGDLASSRPAAVERHRSLAGVVDWSYQLLEPSDRWVAERLSVFRGSFSRGAAMQVLSLTEAAPLDRLAEASLLSVADRGRGSRLLMLEMIRDFLGDRLEESGQAGEVRRAHAEWAAELVETQRAAIRGPDEGAARIQLAADLANVGSGIQWAAAQQETALVVRLARGLYDHVLAGGGREVQDWVATATEAVWEDAAGGDVLLTAATAAMVAGDLIRYRLILERADALGIAGTDVVIPTALEWASLLVFEGRVAEAVEICVREADHVPHDPWKASQVLMRMAQPYAYAGDSRSAVELTRQSLDHAASTGNPTALAWTHYIHGEALIGADPSAAIESYETALDHATSVGNTFVAGLLSVALASALGRHGEPVAALRRYRESIERWRSAGAWSFQSTTLRNLGELLVRLDRPEEAVLIRSALRHTEASSGAGGVDADRDRDLRRQLQERLGSDRFETLEYESQTLSRAAVTELALESIATELAARDATSRFRVIVFTDLERSTEYMAGAGDAAARRSMREYDEHTDDVLSRHRGERVKGTGDGVLATFPSVADALAAVTELVRWADEAVEGNDLPLRLRVGVHAGETIADMDDVHGTVVNVAARVVDQAAGGEIVVTETIRQIAAGSNHDFVDLGESELKGIARPMRLHRLEWH